MCRFLETPGHLCASSPWPVHPLTAENQGLPSLLSNLMQTFLLDCYNYFCIYNVISVVIHSAMESHNLVCAPYFLQLIMP